MQLGDVTMATLLPSWMRGDEGDLALASSVDDSVRKVYEAAQLLTTWDKLDELPEGVLDRLAYELDADWYDYSAPIEAKRQLLRDSDFVHMKKGTVAAVEKVIAAYFGDQKVLEWFEYGGEPHHFKVFTTEPTLVANNLERFLAMLRKVKRLSSKLDSILIGLTGMEQLYIGDAWRSFAHEIHAMGANKVYLLVDSVVSLRETLTVNMGGEIALDADEIVYMLYATRAIIHSRDAVTMTMEHPLDGDVVAYLVTGQVVSERDHVTVRIGG